MDKKTQTAVDWLRKCEGNQFSRVAAYVVIPPHSKPFDKYGAVGKIKVAYPRDGMGTARAFIWDTSGTGIQYRTTSGCGFNKLDAMMDGVEWDGIKLTEDWERQLREAGYLVIQAV